MSLILKMHSNYVKGPKLKAILDEDLECNAKLEKITSLVEGNDVSKEKKEGGLKVVEPSDAVSGEGVGGSKVEEVGVKEGGGYEAVVGDLSGVDKKHATEVLDIIERNSRIDWDRNTFELIISGEKVNFSDLRLLLKKTVVSLPISQPIGLTLFIDELIELKTPANYFKSGDAREIRSQLLKIRSGISSDKEVVETAPDSSGGPSVERNEKRKREEAEEEEVVEEEGAAKKQKLETDEVKDTFDVEPRLLDGLRRSGRLKKDIVESWKAEEEKSNGKKKNGRKRKK